MWTRRVDRKGGAAHGQARKYRLTQTHIHTTTNSHRGLGRAHLAKCYPFPTGLQAPGRTKCVGPVLLRRAHPRPRDAVYVPGGRRPELLRCLETKWRWLVADAASTNMEI